METGTKMTKFVYWGSTVLFSLMMAGAAFGYLTAAKMAEAFAHLGFPAYFRVELAVAKLLGVLVLLAPVPRLLKEWAYAGFTITVVSAFIAHTAVDGVQTAVPPVVALLLLMLSYNAFHKQTKQTKQTNTVGEQIVGDPLTTA